MTSFHTDPRAASAIVTGGPPDLVGEELIPVEPVVVDGQDILVPRSLPGAAEYATVSRAEATARALRVELVETLDYRGGVPAADVRVALDYREAAGTAVASAAVGLEAFANYHLERALGDGGEWETRRGTTKTVDELRNSPLNERYSGPLPALLERPRPTDQPWWPVFRRIQALAVLQRHGLTHPMQRSGLEGEYSLTQRLYSGEYRGVGEMMLATFEHFSPGWISAERRQALTAAA